MIPTSRPHQPTEFVRAWSAAPWLRRTLPLLAALALIVPAFAQGDEPVAIRVEIYVVSEVPTEGGGTSEQYTQATTARPGQVVEYRLFAVNRGDTTLPAGTVVLTGPVPDGTRFVPTSATPSSERILTEFTGPDAEGYSEPPVLAAGGAIDPSDYTAVRWTLLEAMAPGQEEAFFYRVTVQ